MASRPIHAAAAPSSARSTGRSAELFAAARLLFPGGVNSPVRAFAAVGGRPLFMDHGQGPWLIDVDGNRYIDYVAAWGPLAVGHAHPSVVAAVAGAAARGTGFGAPTELENALAERIRSAVPALERIRFVTSGTEATMSVLRLARAATGRERVVKFAGCYHGHVDALLVAAGSGVATLGLPDSPGVTAGAAGDTAVAEYNDLDRVARLLARRDVAAVLVEPVAGNMGLVLPAPGFLAGLRELCTEHGALLVFDEVMTGFRVAPGGAQERFGVRPDLVTLGKVIGGGLPVGAYGGSAELMTQIAPEGAVYQAGTLAGNPVVMAAGLATLELLLAEGAFDDAAAHAERLATGLSAAAAAAGVDAVAAHCGTMFGLFFQAGPVTDYRTARASDLGRYASWFNGMLDEGVYLAPSQFEAGFVSTAHGDPEIDHTLAAARRVMARLAAGPMQP